MLDSESLCFYRKSFNICLSGKGYSKQDDPNEIIATPPAPVTVSMTCLNNTVVSL